MLPPRRKPLWENRKQSGRRGTRTGEVGALRPAGGTRGQSRVQMPRPGLQVLEVPPHQSPAVPLARGLPPSGASLAPAGGVLGAAPWGLDGPWNTASSVGAPRFPGQYRDTLQPASGGAQAEPPWSPRTVRSACSQLAACPSERPELLQCASCWRHEHSEDPDLTSGTPGW